MPAYLLAVVWAALAGTFYGAIVPFWKAEAAMNQAQALLRARPPQFEEARTAYVDAANLDTLSLRPFVDLADIEYQYWVSRGAKPDQPIWRLIITTLNNAELRLRRPKGSPEIQRSLDVERRRLQYTRALLARTGGSLSPREQIAMRAEISRALRIATRLYPTDPHLRADLAFASAQMGMDHEAAKEAREALRLDRLLTPHPAKRLSRAIRERLERELPVWSEASPPEPIRPGASPAVPKARPQPAAKEAANPAQEAVKPESTPAAPAPSPNPPGPANASDAPKVPPGP